MTSYFEYKKARRRKDAVIDHILSPKFYVFCCYLNENIINHMIAFNSSIFLKAESNIF
jgi:hypothetical protein